MRDARGQVGELSRRINSIMSNTARLTPEARRDDVAAALGEERPRILAILAGEARSALELEYAGVERTLGTLTAVSPEELAEAERNLRPALAAAAQRPDMLLNLIRERHQQPADRRLIEEAARGMIDGLGDLDNYAFRDAWNALEQQLTASRGPEEMEALGQRAVLDDLASYLDSAQQLVGIDLRLLDPSLAGEERNTLLVTRAMPEAHVNRYESDNASVMDAA